MTILLAANNATTTLASGIGTSATVITVASGTGSLFPSPSSGQSFKVSLTDAATQSIHEVCLCTSRTTDSLTIVRAQEGTTAHTWSGGDYVANMPTAGTLSNTVQNDQLQSQTFTYVSAGGTSDAITATIASGLTALVDGLQFTFKATAVNTTITPTLTVTLGSTVTSTLTIVKNNNQALQVGDIPGLNAPMTVIYSSVYGAWVLRNPASTAIGVIQPVNGGTGLASLTNNAVLIGSGTASVSSVSPGAAGNVLANVGGYWTSASSFFLPFILTAGTSGNITVPAGATAMKVTMTGAGGGPDGANGGDTTIYTGAAQWVAGGGYASTWVPGSCSTGGGTSGNGLAITGGYGSAYSTVSYGGVSFWGGGGTAVNVTVPGAGAGWAINTSAGGAGATYIIWQSGLTPGSTIPYSVGAASSLATWKGGGGIILIEWFL